MTLRITVERSLDWVAFMKLTLAPLFWEHRRQALAKIVGVAPKGVLLAQYILYCFLFVVQYTESISEGQAGIEIERVRRGREGQSLLSRSWYRADCFGKFVPTFVEYAR